MLPTLATTPELNAKANARGRFGPASKFLEKASETITGNKPKVEIVCTCQGDNLSAIGFETKPQPPHRSIVNRVKMSQ
jgi:hypothetical protein